MREFACESCNKTFYRERKGCRFCSLGCANRGRTRPESERFWEKVAIGQPRDCWPWLANTAKGYGRFQRDGKGVGAHRVAYELANESIPADGFVCHHCDNPLCCNPAHLFLATHAENMADMARKRRSWNGGQRGQANANARLSWSDVSEIRQLAASGASRTEIARRFGTSQPNVSNICNSKRWRYGETQ